MAAKTPAPSYSKHSGALSLQLMAKEMRRRAYPWAQHQIRRVIRDSLFDNGTPCEASKFLRTDPLTIDMCASLVKST